MAPSAGMSKRISSPYGNLNEQQALHNQHPLERLIATPPQPSNFWNADAVIDPSQLSFFPPTLDFNQQSLLDPVRPYSSPIQHPSPNILGFSQTSTRAVDPDAFDPTAFGYPTFDHTTFNLSTIDATSFTSAVCNPSMLGYNSGLCVSLPNTSPYTLLNTTNPNPEPLTTQPTTVNFAPDSRTFEPTPANTIPAPLISQPSQPSQSTLRYLTIHIPFSSPLFPPIKETLRIHRNSLFQASSLASLLTQSPPNAFLPAPNFYVSDFDSDAKRSHPDGLHGSISEARDQSRKEERKTEQTAAPFTAQTTALNAQTKIVWVETSYNHVTSEQEQTANKVKRRRKWRRPNAKTEQKMLIGANAREEVNAPAGMVECKPSYEPSAPEKDPVIIATGKGTNLKEVGQKMQIKENAQTIAEQENQKRKGGVEVYRSPYVPTPIQKEPLASGEIGKQSIVKKRGRSPAWSEATGSPDGHRMTTGGAGKENMPNKKRKGGSLACEESLSKEEPTEWSRVLGVGGMCMPY